MTIVLLGLTATSYAQEIPGVANANRAQVNYMLNCQGCHGAQGTGTVDGVVPEMKNFLGRFLTVDGGREFLVRVPGSANAAMSDEALAEVLNWMLVKISPEQIPATFQPYNDVEVGRWRKQPLDDVESVRARLITKMQRNFATEQP